MLYKYIVPIVIAIFLTGFTANAIKTKEEKQLIENYNAKTELFEHKYTAQSIIDDSIQDKLLMVAHKEIGNIGGEKFWSWYGFKGQTAWCCCFISWCADQCGLIDKGIMPKFSSVSQGYSWFAQRGLYQDSSIIPSPGMVAFFDYPEEDGGSAGVFDHVGIVKMVKDGYIYIIEGNYNNACVENKYPIGRNIIIGYGTPNFEEY